MKFLLSLFVIIIFFKVINASTPADDITSSASSATINRTSPFELMNVYIRCVSPNVTIDKKSETFTFQNAFETVTAVVRSHLPKCGVYHQHVTGGAAYGFSFAEKNGPPMQYVAELLTGKKNWKKGTIESIPITIADVGCGVGISAVLLMSQVIETYEHEKWVLKSPIQFDLFDISPEHQPILQALVAIVNGAYPQYFKVTAGVHDVTQPFARANYYRIVFALNLMHYVPETRWGEALTSIEGTMQKGGMLFMTTDHYLAYVAEEEQAQAFEASIRTAPSPFFSPLVLLFNREAGQEKATRIRNLNGVPFLMEEEPYIPCAQYTDAQLDPHKFTQMLTSHAKNIGKETVSIFAENSKTMEIPTAEVIGLVVAGKLSVQLGNYGFDEESLERAVRLFVPESRLKKLKLGWSKDLMASVRTLGMTLVKQ